MQQRCPDAPQYDFPDTDEGRAELHNLLRQKFEAAERKAIDSQN
jgi:hypothetical protein